MKRPLIFQNGFLASDWLIGDFQSVSVVWHTPGRRRRRRKRAPPPCLPQWSVRPLERLPSRKIHGAKERSIWSDLSSVIPLGVQSMFMMKLYIWVSTTKWTGRQERRSCVAGSHVSQERALYCSRTNLSHGEQTVLMHVVLFILKSGSLIVHTRLVWAAYLSTSEVWLESSGWECLLWRSSSDWTEDTCRCREAWEEKKMEMRSKVRVISNTGSFFSTKRNEAW